MLGTGAEGSRIFLNVGSRVNNAWCEFRGDFRTWEMTSSERVVQ